MCLAVSGEILAITDQSPPAGRDGDPLWRVAEVDFGGVRQQVSLACLSEARVGDRVLVHVGLALSVVEPDGELELADLPPAGPGASTARQPGTC
ncbi:MAG: HypC/HybG/HupF family hydrogenase formation chaperone [Synechococcaceae cyanobacterium ELA182]